MYQLFRTLSVVAWVAATMIPLGAQAQGDLAGSWTQRNQVDRSNGAVPGIYVALPLTDGARQGADAWNASRHTLPEHQCKPHPADYLVSGAEHMVVTTELEPRTNRILAYRTITSWMTPQRTIWMDGRAHPPEFAAHTWQGFSTGQWEGDGLTVTTTHLKNGWYLQDGPFRSDKATLRERWLRHGNYLVIIQVTEDPPSLTEPLMRVHTYELDPGYQIGAYPCEVVEEIDRPEGDIPHYLPEQSPLLDNAREFARVRGLPLEVARGYVYTTRPEYQAVLKALAEKTTGAGR